MTVDYPDRFCLSSVDGITVGGKTLEEIAAMNEHTPENAHQNAPEATPSVPVPQAAPLAMPAAKRATKQAKAGAKANLLASTAGMKLLGEVVYWDSPSNQTHASITKALTDAGLPPEVAVEFSHEKAFNRAAKRMIEDGFVRPTDTNGKVIVFQVTQLLLQKETEGDEREWAAKKVAKLRLDAETGKITCKDPKLADLAATQLKIAMETRTGTDVTQIVMRLFEAHADLFPLRGKGAVYFVPEAFAGFTAKLDTFLRTLGGRLGRFPVPAGTQIGDRSVTEAIADGLAAMVQDHVAAVDGFGDTTRQDTLERSAQKIKATKLKLEAYSTFLADKQAELGAALAEAQDVLLKKIDELSKAKEVRKENNEVAKPQKPILGCSATSVIRWCSKQGWTFERTKKMLDHYESDLAEITVRYQLKNKRGLPPAKLSKAQIKELESI